MFLAVRCLFWLATFQEEKKKMREKEEKKGGKKRQEKRNEKKRERICAPFSFYFLHPYLIPDVSLFGPHLHSESVFPSRASEFSIPLRILFFLQKQK